MLSLASLSYAPPVEENGVIKVQLKKWKHADQCRRHRDRKNQGGSMTALLGTFTSGGALVTEHGDEWQRSSVRWVSGGVRRRGCVK